jgi:serine/threonine-protein kinase HipA
MKLMRRAEIYMNHIKAGMLIQDENGYHFFYHNEYLQSTNPMAISLTLPLQKKEFKSNTLFPFFDGLIPEGWLLNIAEKNWKLNTRDRMGLLLVCCKDCIGAVSVQQLMEETK